MKLSDYLLDKQDLVGVCMIRLTYYSHRRECRGPARSRALYWDYTRWKFSGQNIFFFNEDMRVGHILWTTDPIKVVDDTHAIYVPGDYDIGLELFYGGAIL